MPSRRLLVTGGAGFIGANFVHYWLRQHPDDRVVVLDALTYAGHRGSLADLDELSAFRFVHGDINDGESVEALLREEGIDTVVHFAAESHVDRSIEGPDAFLDANVLGTHELLKAARSVWLGAEESTAHHFHHVSTDEVYGTLEVGDPAFAEDHPYRPNSPYAASKAASDHLVRAYHHTYGLQVTTSNCSNNYGPYQFPEKLIPLMLVNALQGEELPVYGDGSNIRDWLHVRDHCAGIERILEDGRVDETYNIGGGNERTNIELVQALCQVLDDAFEADPGLADRFPDAPPAGDEETASLIRFVRDRPGHDFRYAIDGSKMESELGFAPSISVERGLRETLEWYLANEPWWRGVMDGSYRDWVDRHYRAEG